ncbi:hypothetical protein CERSUDRAFT_125452 [Gelatoporia subvermispora B]|uniref:Protein kinase domain-containing protein n=1 Tax=Ceriporiopsis subvermispora (strain B) TaxID=914234 RepID=M2PEF4_CERS8|nr:hypothetical protein CERSUDRAFT_125452 [Gelatoporia subvermispora B]
MAANVGLRLTGRLWPVPCAIFQLLLFSPGYHLSPLASPTSRLPEDKFVPWSPVARVGAIELPLDVRGVKRAASSSDGLDQEGTSSISHREDDATASGSSASELEDPLAFWSPFGDGYLLQCVLGDGTQGRVFLVEEASNHQYYALKLIPKRLQYSSSLGRRDAIAELYCMKLAVENDLPFLMPVYRSWDDEDHIFFILPFCPETLHHRVSKGSISAAEAKHIAAELILALRDLHSRRVAHRDIKLDNIFISSNGHLMLGDFGFAYQIPDENGDPYQHLLPLEFVGTPGYYAPEIIDRDDGTIKERTCKGDIYTMGLVLHQVFTGNTMPYCDGEDDIVQLAKMKASPRGWANSIKDKLVIDLLDKMLAWNPEERWTAGQLINHPYFTNITPSVDTTRNTPTAKRQRRDSFNINALYERKCSGLNMAPFCGPQWRYEYRLTMPDMLDFETDEEQRDAFNEQLMIDAELDAACKPSDFLYKCPPGKETDRRHSDFVVNWDPPYVWKGQVPAFNDEY